MLTNCLLYIFNYYYFSDIGISKFDREKWRAQLGPVLDLWQQMVSVAGVLVKKKGDSSSSSTRAAAGDSVENPLDAFVVMEFQFSENCVWP